VSGKCRAGLLSVITEHTKEVEGRTSSLEYATFLFLRHVTLSLTKYFAGGYT
jgi:hypothetical protein